VDRQFPAHDLADGVFVVGPGPGCCGRRSAQQHHYDHEGDDPALLAPARGPTPASPAAPAAVPVTPGTLVGALPGFTAGFRLTELPPAARLFRLRRLCRRRWLSRRRWLGGRRVGLEDVVPVVTGRVRVWS